MSQSLNITAVLDGITLLENLVEKLAARREDAGARENLTKTWMIIQSSSVESFVSGHLSITGLSKKAGSIRLPFITSMLFTCVKDDKDQYRILWSSSLS